VLGPLLFTPDDSRKGLGTIMGFFIAIIVLVVLTTLYLTWLNGRHGQRRVTLGKSAIVRDLSLESADEIERLKHVDSPAQEAAYQENDAGDVAPAQTYGTFNKAFADATDLENEDFIFVY
jgi:hypothetical protein